MITFTEYLNEAYSSEMKREIPKKILQDVGNWFARTHNISVQNSEFEHLPKGWKLSDVEGHHYAVWQFKDGTVAISNSYFSTGEHTFSYPKHLDGKKVTEAIKKDVKNVWGIDCFSDGDYYTDDNDVHDLRMNRIMKKK